MNRCQTSHEKVGEGCHMPWNLPTRRWPSCVLGARKRVADIVQALLELCHCRCHELSVRFIVKFDTSPWRLSEDKEIKKGKGLQTLTSTTTKVKDMIPSELVSKAHWSVAVEHSQEFSKLIASKLVAPRHDLDTLDSGRLVLRQMKPAVCCLRLDMQTCNVKMCCFSFSTTAMKEADCKAARSKHNFCILKPISIAQWGIGMIPLPKRCRDMTAIRVRLQMSTRQRLCEELRTYFARCEWMKKWQVSSCLCIAKRYPWTLVSWSYHDLWRYAWNVSLHQLGVVKPFSSYYSVWFSIPACIWIISGSMMIQ